MVYSLEKKGRFYFLGGSIRVFSLREKKGKNMELGEKMVIS
jgi:hypothetical protein